MFLTRLYNAYLFAQAVLEAQKLSNVYLIVKDGTRPKTVANARLITLICIFRKVFESYVLRRIQELPYIALYLAQAGFRVSYSTLTLASLVYIALEQRLYKRAVFLDSTAVFDIVDYSLLIRRLYTRSCPSYLLSILDILVSRNRSRILANREASDQFIRTREVL